MCAAYLCKHTHLDLDALLNHMHSKFQHKEVGNLLSHIDTNSVQIIGGSLSSVFYHRLLEISVLDVTLTVRTFFEGPGKQATWRSDLRMYRLERRMLWGNMIALFKYLKCCHEEE